MTLKFPTPFHYNRYFVSLLNRGYLFIFPLSFRLDFLIYSMFLNLATPPTNTDNTAINDLTPSSCATPQPPTNFLFRLSSM